MRSQLFRFISFLALLLCSSVYAVDADPRVSVKALEDFVSLYGGGEVHSSEVIKSKGTEAPALYFGPFVMNNTFDAVDNIKKKFGGTATLFVFDGEEFIRVSTNVIKGDGTRAIGTKLARNKAYDTVLNKETYCGRVDILGNPYDTCYAPILDQNKNVLGIFYTGYKVGP